MNGPSNVQPCRPWLSLVGIGEDGLDGLSPAAKARLKEARLVVGGRRHLALAGPLAAETLVWPSPIQDAFPSIVARRGDPVCVLASGDPFFFGVGSALARCIDPAEMICVPAPSAFSLAASRLGWSQQDCALLSLHGRPLARILPHLRRGARILALSWDEATPRALATLLTERGYGASTLTVCENLGGPRERLRRASAGGFDLDAGDPLNTIALEVEAAPDARITPRTPGLPDAWFEHDGQITKREIRALTLSALAPRAGDFLWDIGAGAGSVAIEWMLADPANRAAAIERDLARAARIRRNAETLGAPELRVVDGAAPDALAGLPRPDAVFLGGGATAPGVLDHALAALRPGGRLVLNAVTLETQAEAFRRFGARGGDLMQMQISRIEPVGGFHAMKPALPVLQWSWSKPW